MKVLNASQMREIDRATIEDFGIPGPVLMENAGREIFREIERRFPELHEEKFVIVAGKGNNGGDGLVVARHLLNQGASPLVLLLASGEEVKGDAALNLRAARAVGVDVREVRSEDDWRRRKAALGQATVVIDAVFGTGLLRRGGRPLRPRHRRHQRLRARSRSPWIFHPGCPRTGSSSSDRPSRPT